ncbi:hypothetical protein HK100_000644 [Physocladia obscura]|uniref:AAA+ ATPase domain-containing protein n=1 Tax=Physocladia obscura TaxID=109957 RepID=A0AAD5T8R0_9FUNG|nr:hypothetical protein HK100_000644 [Physocladia obscura]
MGNTNSLNGADDDAAGDSATVSGAKRAQLSDQQQQRLTSTTDVFATLLSQAVRAQQQQQHQHNLTNSMRNNHVSVSGGGSGSPGAKAKGEELDHVLAGSLFSDVWALNNASSVRVFVAAGRDFVHERDALVASVWPQLARFCSFLNLDFAVVDLDWNVSDDGVHNNMQTQRFMAKLQEGLSDSTISIFIGLLGDKYGSPALPTIISPTDYEAIRSHLLSIPEHVHLVPQLLDLWYTQDNNHRLPPSPPSSPTSPKVPSLHETSFISNDQAIPGFYKLNPVQSIFPAFSSTSADSEVREHAAEIWDGVCEDLARVLTIGAVGAFGTDGAALKGFGRALVDLGVGYAFGRKRDGVFCFQRTFLDLKRNANENAILASKYIDMDPQTGVINKDRTSEITRLRSKHRATRFYAIPWRTDLGGFNPELEKLHATYLTSFCEDVGRLIGESILKQYAVRPGAGVIGEEVVRHAVGVLRNVDGFVGRRQVLESIETGFLGDLSKKALIIYGPSGIGKTALMSKVAERIYNTYPQAVLVTRLVGTSCESMDSIALLRSMCSQIVGAYGHAELKDKVDFEASISAEIAEATGELTLEEKLGNLDNWPPITYEGLKAGFEVALKLADDNRPLFVVLDALDELSIEDDARTLEWLPKIIPPYVKIIISTAPTSLKHSTFSIINTLYPTWNVAEHMYLELPVFSYSEVDEMIQTLMQRDNCQLQEEQRTALISKCSALKMPLYIRTAWTLHAKKWTSSTSMHVIEDAIKAETVPGLIEEFFDELEAKLGRYFVSKSLAYLTAARQGLSRYEFEDLLSLDETVMNEVFKFNQMPVRRIPPIYVERLLEELGDSIVQKHVYGVRAIFWGHHQILKVAEDRYLEQGQAGKIHGAFSNYWEAKYANKEKQYHEVTGLSKTENRYVINQSLLISGKPNIRRVSAIVWHQLAIGSSGFRRAAKTLQDISHLSTAVHGGLLWDVLACYRYAMSLENGDPIIVDQLNDYYPHAEVLLYDPNRLVPVAVNLYEGSVVADEARKWILLNSPGLSWIEWTNRPTARGEPIVTLRGTDGGVANDVITVTGRDTYDERLVLTGVRTFDNEPTLFLYDIEQTDAASGFGGGKAKLLAKYNFMPNKVYGEIIEQGVPLVCSFSRKGDKIAVGGRSVVLLDGMDLTIKKVGRDPTLPEGDLITIIAWTAKDGCVITASDGSMPGRISLWNANSLTLLKVLETKNNPRQPIMAAYSSFSFWDEVKEAFVIMDIDELASDPDSTDNLQYIHNKPHCDPAPDANSRFAISFAGNYAIIAEESGHGYLLIDMNAKRPVARLEVEVDRVRYITLSHDGKRVAVVPVDDKVIFIHGITQDSKPQNVSANKRDGGVALYSYQHLGTILGVDPAYSDGSPISCQFSRSGKTVMTDGEYGSVRVWNVNELGDHSAVRYASTLAVAYQTVIPIRNNTNGYMGWAVNEGNSYVSFTDKRARNTLQTNDVATNKRFRRNGFSKKDIVTGIASHPAKPIVASVTNNGNLTLLYAEQAFHEKGWTGAIKSVLTKKVDVGYSVSLNVMKEGLISPSCVTFLDSASFAANGGASGDILSFAVGFEDGTVSIWDWNSAESMAQLLPTVTLNLQVGRVSSLTPTNIPTSRRLAVTVDDGTLLLWEGLSSSTFEDSIQVLVQPGEVNDSYISMRPATKLHNRRSVTSILSITGLLERNTDRAIAIAFSNTQEQLLATGETDGMITIWNTEAKVKRSLLIHTTDIVPAPVTAIAWAADDAALVSLTEDKRVAIHNTVTGNIVWIHDLWMIPGRVNNASFSVGARELAILDHDGTITCIQIHGEWPTSLNADVFSALKGKASDNDYHPTVKHRSAFPSAPDPEFAEFSAWNSSVTDRLMEARTIKNSRSAYHWEYSTGSNTHGHVALIRLNDGLPRGCYEVVCNVEVPADATEETLIPLKFVCWTAGDLDVVDPELDVIHGFSRLLPVQEQIQLAGSGTVCLRLGFVKSSCRLETCCIDLTRIAGEGEPIACGDVHFVPVDPKLYRPDYECPAELADAFDHLSVDFDEFEYSQGRRGSLHNHPANGVHPAVDDEFPDLLVHNPHELFIKGIRSNDNDESAAGDIMWDAGDDNTASALNGEDESYDRFDSVDIVTSFEKFGSAKTSKKKQRKSVRMSVMEGLAGVRNGMSGVVGGILSSAASALPASVSVVVTPQQVRAKKAPEDIEQEMEEARQRGREQARKFEEADEYRAAQAAKQREWMARQLEFEQDARRKDALMRMQREARGGAAWYVDQPVDSDEEEDPELVGVDEEVKREARRLMHEMLQKEMEMELREEDEDNFVEEDQDEEDGDH